jgi:cobalt-zinc-cadmium efflux system outer membrane protein
MKRRTIAALFLVSLLGRTIAAQTATPYIDRANGLALDQAIAQALAKEPSIRAARSTIDLAQGTRLQAGLRKNPMVSAELRQEPSGTDSQTTVNIEWPLDLFRRQGRIAVADREITVAAHAVADRERLLAAEVRDRFGEALTAIRNLATLDDVVDAVRRQRDLLRSRVEQGASPPLERDQVEVELRRLSADRSLQLGRVERALFELGRAVGAGPDAALTLRETLEDVVRRESSLPIVPGDAAGLRADVRAAAARIAVADARIDRAEREGRFDVSLYGGYMRMDAGFPQIGLSPAGTPERVGGLFHYLTGGATVTLPFLNRNQGEVPSARAERAAAVAMQESAVLSARTELAMARTLDQRAREAARAYTEDARVLARQNLSVVQQSYELGRTTVFEVLAEQKRYLEVERAYTETLRAVYDARTALNRALGEIR